MLRAKRSQWQASPGVVGYADAVRASHSLQVANAKTVWRSVRRSVKAVAPNDAVASQSVSQSAAALGWWSRSELPLLPEK